MPPKNTCQRNKTLVRDEAKKNCLGPMMTVLEYFTVHTQARADTGKKVINCNKSYK